MATPSYFEKCPKCGKLRFQGQICPYENKKDHGGRHDGKQHDKRKG